MDDATQHQLFFEGRFILLDENGHLVHAGDWSEGLARQLADIDGIMWTKGTGS